MIASLDFHAHIDPAIPMRDLDSLDACVVAVTRNLKNYEATLGRSHPSTLWALGVHPSLQSAHTQFDKQQFQKHMVQTAVLGEVGLDGKSKVSLERQLQTFDEILQAAAQQPRLMSIHSSFATEAILNAIDTHRPKGVVLHWWQGDSLQTERAVDLGCYFSVNFAQTRSSAVLRMLPMDRVLTETDHPFGDRRQPGPHRPGLVTGIEEYLAATWATDIEGARRQIWSNLRDVATETQTLDLLPLSFQKVLLAL